MIRGLDRVNDYVATIVSTADNYSEQITLSDDDTINVDTDASASVSNYQPVIEHESEKKQKDTDDLLWYDCKNNIDANYTFNIETRYKTEYGITVYDTSGNTTNYDGEDLPVTGNLNNLDKIEVYTDYNDGDTIKWHYWNMKIDVNQTKSATVNTQNISRQ